jgi:purine nucleoside permease
MARVFAAFLALLTIGFAAAAPARPPAAPLEVRVVVAVAFEYERDGKVVTGELKTWRERWPLATAMPLPAGTYPLHYDARTKVLGFVSGMQSARAAASTMALGLDPRFDLSHAYWVVGGIAGVDPKVASIGSAAWARWVVDADQGQEMDIRDAPADWPTGVFPQLRTAPYQAPAPPYQSFVANIAYPLNPALVGWAYEMTRGVKLADDEKLAAQRKLYGGEGAKPPFVLIGDGLMSSRFKHGVRQNDHSRRWVDYWTGGKGVFTMAAQEDAGILQALTQLAGAGRVRLDRVLVLRAGSDYTLPPPGVTAIDMALDLGKSGPPGMAAAYENLYRTASPVVRYLTENWAVTRDKVPGK